MILYTAKDIGALIRDRRTELGLSQVQLAKRIGVSRIWIVQIEKGKPNAQLGLILRALQELKILLHAEIAQEPTCPEIDLGAIIDRTMEKL